GDHAECRAALSPPSRLAHEPVRVIPQSPELFLGEDGAGGLGLVGGHEDHDLALRTHAEGMDGLGEATAQDHPDALALEAAAHDHRFELIGAAAHLGEADFRLWAAASSGKR